MPSSREEALEKALAIYTNEKNWQCPRCGGRDSLNCYMGKWCGPTSVDGMEPEDITYSGQGHGYDVARAALALPADPPKEKVTMDTLCKVIAKELFYRGNHFQYASVVRAVLDAAKGKEVVDAE